MSLICSKLSLEVRIAGPVKIVFLLSAMQRQVHGFGFGIFNQSIPT